MQFRTKPELAGDLVEAVRANGLLPYDWIVADELYGSNGDLKARLEERGERVLMEVPVSTTVWTKDPATEIPPSVGQGQPPSRPRRDSVCSVRDVAASLPQSAWQTLQLREGTQGPVMFEFAAVRVWQVRHRKPGPPSWLVIRRSLDPTRKRSITSATPTRVCPWPLSPPSPACDGASKNSSRTAKDPWGCATTKLAPGRAGIIIWLWSPWLICSLPSPEYA